jgi:hypothetical protein
MAATKRSKDYLNNESTGSFKDSNNITASQARDMIHSVYEPQGICQGRLTLESGVPVSTTDQTAKTTVYFTPYVGNCVGLYDGTSWTLHTFTERSLALGTLTSGQNYDVFLYDNSGTLTLELTAWTNNTTRATALTTQDGVYVKTGATTRRYLGTLQTMSTTTTELSASKLGLWNLYNQVAFKLKRIEATTSWTYNSTTVRQANNSSSNSIWALQGLALSPALVTAEGPCTHGATNAGYYDIGLGSTTPAAESISRGGAGSTTAIVARMQHKAVGYYEYRWLEACVNATASCTFYGTDTGFKGGLMATVMG